MGSLEWTICIKIENIKAYNPNKNGNVDVGVEHISLYKLFIFILNASHFEKKRGQHQQNSLN